MFTMIPQIAREQVGAIRLTFSLARKTDLGLLSLKDLVGQCSTQVHGDLTYKFEAEKDSTVSELFIRSFNYVFTHTFHK